MWIKNDRPTAASIHGKETNKVIECKTHPRSGGVVETKKKCGIFSNFSTRHKRKSSNDERLKCFVAACYVGS